MRWGTASLKVLLQAQKVHFWGNSPNLE